MLKHCATVLCVVALMWFTAGAAPAGYYVVTDLGTLGSGPSFATAVNGDGVVVGYTYPAAPSPYPAAFVYSAGSIQDLGQGLTARACGINGSFAVGRSGSEQAFRYDLTTGLTTLLTPATTQGGRMPVYSTAFGVNASGQVVGQSTILGNGASAGDAGLWTVGSGGAVTATDLGTLGGDYSCAMGINDGGLIAGYSEVAPGGAVHALVWNAGGGAITKSDIGALGGSTSNANAINNSGQVVGYATTPDEVSHAFSWTSSTGMINLDAGSSLGETASVANGINAGGSVVGSMTISGAAHAFLYSGATMIDLNSFINPTSGWLLGYAKGISDSGEIAGWGANPAGQTRAFLLRPALSGDTDLDGTVNIQDLSRVLTNYDKTGMTWADGDFNDDGTVNISDLSNVLTNYDKTRAASAAGIRAVPEPGTLVLLVASLVGLLGRRRRKGK
jgi:probable HAF family extracellular repeat protein